MSPHLAHGQTSILKYIQTPEHWKPVTPFQPGVNANGDINLRLPIAEISSRPGGLAFSVQLNYRSSIKVGQPSSWVGLGWNFDPGSITRNVKSIPRPNKSGPNTPLGSSDAYAVDYTRVPSREPDEYTVYTPEGSFSMYPNGFENGCVKFNIVEYMDWKVSCSIGSPGVTVSARVEDESSQYFNYYSQINIFTNEFRKHDNITGSPIPDFSSFVVAAPSGNRYVFAAPLLGSLETWGPGMPSQDYQNYYVNTWRLISILAPNFSGNDNDPRNGIGDWLYFEYTEPAITFRYARENFEKSFQMRSYPKRVTSKTHVMDFVSSPKDSQGDEVDSRQMNQVAGGFLRYLSSINICYNTGLGTCDQGIGQIVKRIVLDQERFVLADYISNYTNPVTGDVEPHYYKVYRYLLKSIKEYDMNNSLVNVFDLDYVRTKGDGSLFQAMNYSGWALNIDDMGFFNFCGDPSRTMYPPDQCIGTTQDGSFLSLRQLIYPNGGKTNYFYENDIMNYHTSDSQWVFYYCVLDYSSCDANINLPYGSKNLSYSKPAGNRARQGGARVTRIEDDSGFGIVTSKNYSYGSGELSAIPGSFFKKFYGQARPFGEIFDRGEASIYYDKITMHAADGGTDETQYRIPAHCGLNCVSFGFPSRPRQVLHVLHQGGGYYMVHSDNAYLAWGSVLKKMTRRSDSALSAQADCPPSGVFVSRKVSLPDLHPSNPNIGFDLNLYAERPATLPCRQVIY